MSYRLFPLGDGMGIVFRDMTDRKRAEEQRDLLISELEHRVKNTLATVQSIASQSFRTAGVEPEALRAFDARLIALGNVHSVLTKQSWDAADLHDVVWAALRPHSAPDRERFTVEGPNVQVGPKCAVAFSMAVHELATNAIKYGALSAETGHVDIAWSAARRSLSLAMARTRRAAGRRAGAHRLRLAHDRARARAAAVGQGDDRLPAGGASSAPSTRRCTRSGTISSRRATL